MPGLWRASGPVRLRDVRNENTCRSSPNKPQPDRLVEKMGDRTSDVDRRTALPPSLSQDGTGPCYIPLPRACYNVDLAWSHEGKEPNIISTAIPTDERNGKCGCNSSQLTKMASDELSRWLLRSQELVLTHRNLIASCHRENFRTPVAEAMTQSAMGCLS